MRRRILLLIGIAFIVAMLYMIFRPWDDAIRQQKGEPPRSRAFP